MDDEKNIVAREAPAAPKTLNEDDLDALSAGAYGGSNSCEPYAGDNTCEPPRKGAGRAELQDLTIAPRQTDHSTGGRVFSSD